MRVLDSCRLDKDILAWSAAVLDNTPGRDWRSTEDTAGVGCDHFAVVWRTTAKMEIENSDIVSAAIATASEPNRDLYGGGWEFPSRWRA